MGDVWRMSGRHPPVSRITDRCKNITLRAVTIDYIPQDCVDECSLCSRAALIYEHLSLLVMIALLTVQSCAQTFIHNAIMFIDTSDNASYNQVHWLTRTSYLSIKASNDVLQP